MQYAIHAIPYAKLFVERLDVDIRRPVLDRLVDDQVHHLDDQLFLGHLLEVADIVVILIVDRALRLLHVLYHAGHIGLLAQPLNIGLHLRNDVR